MTPPVRRVADIRYGEVVGYRPLELDLYLPEGSEVPVVVYVHGGGWQRGSRRDPPPLLEADFYDQIACPRHRASGWPRCSAGPGRPSSWTW
jgi:hypothetical protein